MRQFTQIKGLSEVRRLPRLGKIRLGIRVATKKGRTKDCAHPEGSYCFRCSFPKEVSYFVLPPEARAIYGDQPTEIDVMFPVDDPGVIFPQAYKWYGSDQGLKCKGDGEVALRRLADVTDSDLKTDLEQAGQQPDDLVEIPCPCPLLEQGKCGPKGCLMVMLPRVGCGGVYQIDTGSVMNLTEINSTLAFLDRLLDGRISMVPLKLRRVPQEVQYADPQTGKATKKTHYLLKLIFEGTMDQVLQLREGRMLPASRYELPAPVESGPEPTGECPIEINGEVVDSETGELIGPAAPPPMPPPLPLPSALKKLRTAVLAEGIHGQQFLSFVAERYAPGGLLPDTRGVLYLRDLPELVAADLLSRLPDVLVEYRDWEQARSSPPVPPLQQEETSAEKLAKAEALAPRVTRRPEGGYSVPSQRDGHGSYLIREEAVGWTCQCDGYFYRAEKDPAYQCVHIMAARMAAPGLEGGGV